MREVWRFDYCRSRHLMFREHRVVFTVGIKYQAGKRTGEYQHQDFPEGPMR